MPLTWHSGTEGVTSALKKVHVPNSKKSHGLSFYGRPRPFPKTRDGNSPDEDLQGRVVEELGIPVELLQHLTEAAADGLLQHPDMFLNNDVVTFS
jgi:hypothetical protein